jgi:hypothetical protein
VVPQPLARLAIASAVILTKIDLIVEPPVTSDQAVQKMPIASLGLCAIQIQASASFPLEAAVPTA